MHLPQLARQEQAAASKQSMGRGSPWVVPPCAQDLKQLALWCRRKTFSLALREPMRELRVSCA